MSKVKYIVEFKATNDKNRGIIIESFKVTIDEEGKGAVLKEFMFKYHDQHLDRHCGKIQNIVRSAKVLRTKKITVDITPFKHEYYNVADKSFRFKGIKLKSINEQAEEARCLVINKEISIIKRKKTIAEKKKSEVAEHNRKLAEYNQKEEKLFQEERAKKIAELNEVQME